LATAILISIGTGRLHGLRRIESGGAVAPVYPTYTLIKSMNMLHFPSCTPSPWSAPAPRPFGGPRTN